MKKLFITVMTVGAICFGSANAQTRVATIQDGFSFIPSHFTNSGKPMLFVLNEHVEYVGDSYNIIWDSITIYNEQIQRVRNIEINSSESEEVEGLVYYDIDATGVSVRIDEYLYLSQTLFNNDAEFEYVTYGGIEIIDGYSRHASRIEIHSSNGNVINTIECEEGYYFYTNEEHIYLYKFGGEVYLVSHEYSTTEEDRYVFYRINREQASITRVENTLPFSVRPTVASRGEQITIELGENTSATEIEVINCIGQTVKRVPVQDGQREVKLTVDNGGMHLVNARSGNRQGTTKIIVR